jgi:hypothetical protein
MASLEDALDRVEFNPHTTNDNSATMHAEPGTSGPPVALSIPLSTPTSVPTPSAPVTPITPITPTSFNVVQDRPTPSTPASSTAVKRKAEGDDSSRHESRPPQSSKGKSSSKSQRLSMPSALEDFGGKMAHSLSSATTAFQETVAGHFVEPIPLRKQKAILRVQEEEDLDVHEIVTLINLFESDVSKADSYLSIKRDAVRQVYLAQYLEDYRKGKNRAS